MTARRMAAPRRRSALEWSAIALAFVFHAAFFTWFPSLRSPNELTRVYLASALVEDGTVCIDQQLKRNARIFDLSEREVDGRRHYYSDKAPGVAFLALPALALYEKMVDVPLLTTKVRLTRFVVSTVPTVLLLWLLLDVLGAYLQSPRLPALLVLAYALGSVATPYASMAFGHQLSGVVLFALFCAILRASSDGSAWWSAAIGAGASLAVMVEYQNVLLLVPFGSFYLLRVAARPRHLLAATLAAAPLTLLLLAYHQAAWGSPFKTGYSFIASSFREVHAQGMLGVAWPRPAHAYLSFLSPAKGLFFFAPWLALCVPGLVLAWRSGALALRFSVAFVVLYALFVSALIYPVGGWTVSQRHLVPAVPFMLLPIGLLVERLARFRELGRILFVGLALPALLACGLSAVVWPHWQEQLVNPFWQLGWPLFRDGWVAPCVLGGAAASRLLACAILGGAALLLLNELMRSARSRSAGMLAVFFAMLLSASYVALARLPGREQAVTADRAFIERVYQSDPSTARANH